MRGANGDERGFNENNHEGVVDDDVYFARLPRHDVQAGEGRSAVRDAARAQPGAVTRPAAGRCGLRARGGAGGARGRAAGRAHARRPDHEPHAAAAARGADFFVEQEARVFRQKVDSAESVTVGVDEHRPAGHARRRPAAPAHRPGRLPVLDPGAGLERRRRHPTRRRFRAAARARSSGPASHPASACSGRRATLAPRKIAGYLPLRVRLQTLVDGRPLAAGERRSGDLSLALTLENATQTKRAGRDRARGHRVRSGARSRARAEASTPWAAFRSRSPSRFTP